MRRTSTSTTREDDEAQAFVNPTAASWARRIGRWQRRLSPSLPDVSPEDLALILACVLQPRDVPRRWLMRKVTGGDGYAI